ncbi:MAG: chemotaxis protein CheW [Pseudomonadota bacterium]
MIAVAGEAERARNTERAVLASGAAMSYLTLQVGPQIFGIRVACVRRILEPLPVAVLPRAPHGIEGLIDLDGESITLVDLAGPLGLMSEADAESRRMVVLELGSERRPVTVLADRVLDVVEISESAIEPPPSAAADAELVTGITRIGDGVVILIDIERAFSDMSADPFDFS